jgi:hypothetical protein
MSVPLGLYFDFRVERPAAAVMDRLCALVEARRSLLVCFHPHGLFAAGTGLTMLPLPTALPFLAPTAQPRLAIHWLLFRVPGVRELLLWYGCVEAAWPTITAQLASGTVVGLVPGGVREMAHTRHDGIRLVHGRFLTRAYASNVVVVPCVVHGETEVCYIFNPSWRWFQAVRALTFRWLRYPLPTFFWPRPPGLQPTLRTAVGAPLDPRDFGSETKFRAAYEAALVRLQ